MRPAFFRALTRAAQQDAHVLLMTGDLGFMAVEPYQAAVPSQFHNAGVSESTMVGMAAGLAATGSRVFVYSIAPFVTLRVLEFIRNDVCQPRLPVTIVGVGAGYAYAQQAFTHHALEDMAVMRALPHMTVICPADPPEVEAAVAALAHHEGPAYLRLGKAGEPLLHTAPPPFQIGRAIEMRPGHDASIVACGSVLGLALGAAERLAQDGLRVRVLSMHTVKPIDADAVHRAMRETRALVTVEEHSVVGGLGSAVAEIVAESARRPGFRRVACREGFIDVAAGRDHLLARSGVTVDGVVAAVRDALGEAS
jgi:transketolase